MQIRHILTVAAGEIELTEEEYEEIRAQRTPYPFGQATGTGINPPTYKNNMQVSSPPTLPADPETA